jgi:hypothetical protein
MNLAFITYMQAKKRRLARESNKYSMAVMQDMKEGRKMACEVIDCSEECTTKLR